MNKINLSSALRFTPAITKVALLTILSFCAAAMAAPNTNQSNQSYYQSANSNGAGGTTYLGQSMNPTPGSTGSLPRPVNNLGTGPQISANQGQPGMYPQAMPGMNNVPGLLYQEPQLQGQPAWAQGGYYAAGGFVLHPFGAGLFRGRFANTYSDDVNPAYVIAPGDRIVIRIWGARQYDDVLVVDQQGNIFVPEVGPIYVQGITNSALQSTVAGWIGQVFTSNVEVYVNLLSSQPVGVYVTGFVNNPGQYAGGVYDSLLSYLDRAGGIDFKRGSFREILVKRDDRVIGTYDLYSFIVEGNTPKFRFQDGDVIVVGSRGASVSVRGLVREEALYELKTGAQTGGEVVILASPETSVSHVSITGTRNKRPENHYLTLEEFESFTLEDGDIVTFAADVQGRSIITKVSGAVEGLSHFPINKNRRLRDLLSYVEVDPRLGNISSLYIKRVSVAQQQKQVIADSLRRLEQSALTATSSSVDEAQIRVQEASLIQDFVSRVAVIEPDGIVVVARGGVVSDILLEDGDEIVIPQVTDVVTVAGEVMMPKAVTFDENMTLDDYLGAAGGVSNRADDTNILVAKANGEVGLAEDLGIESGDQILVMPRFDSKNMQLAKDIMQILYQLAVATHVVVDL